MSDVVETADEAVPFRRRAPDPVPGLLLLWVDDAPRYVAFPLSSGPQVIGREAASAVAIPEDATLSRKHAEVSLDAASGALVVRDLASRHGTYVDGERVHGERRVPLARSVLRVGAALFLGVADLNPHLALIRQHPQPTSLFDPATESVLGPLMRAFRAQIADAAKTSAPLLVLGESGAGKAAIAKLFHDAGPRARGPFVSYNSATLSPALADSELFGAVRGAYTGADRDKSGAFVAADTGVLFFDELADLPLEVQAKLLQVVEDGWVRPLGADPSKRTRVDVAIVSATHADLRAAVDAGRFRGDLYQRLRRRELHLPPLRDRLEEVPFLLDRYRALHPGAPAVSTAMVEACLLYAWPFNVREIINVVDHAVRLSARESLDRLALDAGALDASHLRGVPTLWTASNAPAATSVAPEVARQDAAREGRPTAPPPAMPSRGALADADFAAYAEREHGGNVTAAARARGISPSTAHDMITRHRKRHIGRE